MDRGYPRRPTPGPLNNGCDVRRYPPISATGSSTVIQGDVSHNYILHVDEEKLNLKSLYFKSMDSRRKDIRAINEPTCRWVWRTKFVRWLKSNSSKAFWIAGKPGSGKSTLMNYLSRDSNITSKLPTNRCKWIVVDFFFDFRQADEIGNSVEGMLRTMLYQIYDRCPTSVAVLKTHLDSAQQSLAASVDHFRDLLLKVLKPKEISVFMFIDGLDEFHGDISDLLELILNFRRLENVKFCLASRPEAEIRHILGALPSIHMSDYNSDGILQYIGLAIDKYQPRLDSLINPDLKEIILHKAEGVFLWVHLVVQEILQAYRKGANAAELKATLETLPSELQELYKRILDRLPQGRLQETALMFFIVDSASFQVTEDLFRSTLEHLILQLEIPNFLDGITDTNEFRQRFYANMGGLLELSPYTHNFDGEVDDFDLSTVRIRLLHETVRAFTRTDGWCEKHLPPQFRRHFPNTFWSRICATALHVATFHTFDSVEQIAVEIVGRHKSYDDFYGILTEHCPDPNLIQLIPLIHHAIRHLPLMFKARSTLGKHDNLYIDLKAAFCSRLASLHFALVDSHFANGMRFPYRSMQPQTADLMQAAAHRDFAYIHSEAHRLRRLTDAQRDDLVIAAILSCSIYSAKCVEEIPRASHHPQAGLHDTVDLILRQNSTLKGSHIAIFLILGYASVPKYLKILQGRRNDLEFALLENLQDPKWNSDSDVTPFFPCKDLLGIWACQYSFAYPQQSSNYAMRLKYLLDLGLDLNDRSRPTGGIVHQLLIVHGEGHRRRAPASVGCYHQVDRDTDYKKLYLLEKFGAHFSIKETDGTPLESLRKLKDAGQQEDDRRSFYRHQEREFDKLIAVLEHKERLGHLPQPESSVLTATSIEGVIQHCSSCAYMQNPRPAPAPPLAGPIQTQRAPNPSVSRIPRPVRRLDRTN